MALNIYLKFGSKGENVKKVQVALGLKASGIYDKQTENAVKTFQKEKGLSY
jgi:peptidoglycan hydrolase-like protein with peptidoglycan-binding domain